MSTTALSPISPPLGGERLERREMDSTSPRQYWANRIRGNLQNAVESIVQAGRDLIQARGELGHGEYLKMVEGDLGMAPRTAQRLVKIALHPVISDATHGSYLPPSMRTLSELATLPEPLVLAKIKDGTIHASMERNDVYRLKPGHAEAQHTSRMTPIDKLNAEHEQVVAHLEEQLAAAEAKADSKNNHVHGTVGTDNSEWNTPEKYIELARTVLGKIDVDPASNQSAQETIQAKSFYTKHDDGLSKDWIGTVWCNPPYASMPDFAAKMLEEIDNGNVSAGILLTNNYTENPWFHELSAKAAAVCFVKGRIKFNAAEERERPGSPTRGQTFFYFGPDSQAFEQAFRDVGFIWLQHPPEPLIPASKVLEEETAATLANMIIGETGWTKAVAIADVIFNRYENEKMEPEKPKPKRAGRPKGSKNKPKNQ